MQYDQVRHYLVYEILQKQDGIYDPAVLAAMDSVPRHEFVLKEYLSQAYENHPLPIGHEQTISQPLIVAFMTQEAMVNKNSKVLEIGTGCGYQAAVLGHICKEVYSIEVIEALAVSAKERLKELGYGNVHVKCGDGNCGWPEHAPYDAILATAAAEDFPQALIDQLKPGGIMIIPITKNPGDQVLFRLTKISDNDLKKEELLPVRFVPFTNP